MANIYILYSYYETDIAKDNLTYFIKHGYVDDKLYEYIFIINGYICNVDIPDKSNIKIIKRENEGYDFGGWAYALQIFDLLNKMNDSDRIIFMNSTIKGPYISDDKNWINEFTDMINNTTKLAGISINCTNYLKNRWIHPFIDILNQYKIYKNGYAPHIQSMLLVTDKIGLNIGITHNIFDGINISKDLTKEKFVIIKEIGYSAIILENGYNINCILPKYKDKNYLDIETHNLNNNNGYGGDPFYNNGYFGKTIDPYEAIFIKTNRNICYDINHNTNIKLINVFYGKNKNIINVSDKFNNYISIYDIDKINPSETFGDPYQGISKKLFISTDYQSKYSTNNYCQFIFNELNNKFVNYIYYHKPVLNKTYKIGLCISTYFNKDTHEQRLNIFKQSINSLMKTSFNKNPNTKIIIVDDGSEIKNHLEWIRENYKDTIQIYEKNHNSGIFKIKNTCIRLLMEENVDVLFLSDDNNIYLNPNWFEYYLDAIEKTNFGCWTYIHPDVHLANKKSSYINNFEFTYLSRQNGCLLILTKDVINKIGYFKMIPNKYGYEYINYIFRAIYYGLIPECIDISNSENLLIPMITCPLSDVKNYTQDEKYLYDMSNNMECIE